MEFSHDDIAARMLHDTVRDHSNLPAWVLVAIADRAWLIGQTAGLPMSAERIRVETTAQLQDRLRVTISAARAELRAAQNARLNRNCPQCNSEAFTVNEMSGPPMPDDMSGSTVTYTGTCMDCGDSFRRGDRTEWHPWNWVQLSD